MKASFANSKSHAFFALVSLLLGTALLPGVKAHEIVAEKELLIVDPSVTTDSRAYLDGPWSFGKIVRNFAQAHPTRRDIQSWVTDWLGQWSQKTMANGLAHTPRFTDELLRYWPRENRRISWEETPFQLVSILFRLDIRSPQSPAGEGRFVYVLTEPVTQKPIDFFVILEFRLPTDEWNLKEWARQIHHLSSLPFGPQFNRHLQTLTDRFTGRIQNLNSLRVNDFLFDPSWELRDFGLDANGRARPRTIEQTPHPIFDGDSGGSRASELVDWIGANEERILGGDYTLPFSLQTEASHVPTETFQWLRQAPLRESVRRSFSLRTCNGCHSGETEARFVHLFLEKVGQAAVPSDFLRSELALRAEDLKNILVTPAPQAFPPRRFVH